jgi:EAL domain-containing protein (putative c-di-GMP-specific phosphodiesterase class I)/DNA-binding NarL/FixJ family response regulator
VPIWSTQACSSAETSLADGGQPRLKSLALALAVALEATEHETSACCWLDDRMSTPPAPAGDLILYRIAQDALANVCTHARAANVTVTLLERAGTHVVRVADDGVGFSPAADGSLARECGLGIMRARARLAGGGLHVESVPGRGTVVEAWLPAARSSGAVTDVAEDAVIRVLIAEDDGQVRQALADMVAAEPSMEVVAAVAGAAEAIAAARRFRPAVALLDVRMPGGGPAAARGIKDCSPQTRVLGLSAFSNRARVLEMLEAGADGYLVKGASVQSILEAITNAASGQGSLSVEVTADVIEELAEELHARRSSDDRALEIEQRVRQAIRDDDGVLRMVFQPISTLAGETVGVEALARFVCEPLQSPDRWFAEAAEAGLEEELELLAARKALNGLSSVHRALYLTINVSPGTLATAAFRRLIEESDGSRVIVEITEHARIDDYDSLRESLALLRALGVRVAIDDAGAGFASLRHILRLQPEFIKLDRALIDHIDSDSSLQALAAGLISFAGRIGATIIAEGIERAEEVEKLTELGVLFGQGFYFARPGPLPAPLRLVGGMVERAAPEAARGVA